MTGSRKAGSEATTMEEAIRRLSDLLAEENAALETMDFARAGSLLAPKHDAADALAAAWRAADPGNVPTDQMHALGRLAEENRQLLKRAMRVQSRVLDLVAKAARSAASSGYGAAGRPATRTAVAHSLKARV